MEQPISVLHFTNSLARGGAEEHILTLLRGLDRKLFRLHLVCPPALAALLKADLPDDVELIPIELRKPSQLSAAFGLRRALRKRRVKILHSHLFYSSLFASPIGWLARVPVIVETQHLRESWRQGWLKSHFIIDRIVGRFVDCYIAVSEANARYLADDKRLPGRKIMVIRNGCDLRRFDPAAQAPLHLKRELGFADDDPVILVVGRLEPQKGHQVLLHAFPTVRKEFPNARLVCLGEGSLRGDLESKVRALGIEGAVRFVGFQANVPEWLALADFTVLPSFYEGLPIAAIESLAAARPVVASAVDGTPEVVVDGKTGFTVPPGDAAALAAALCSLLRDPKLRRTMGIEGRRWVAENFSQEQQLRRTEELYLRAVERHQGTERSLVSQATGDAGPAGERALPRRVN
jgi:glycosyltransferase involved in cell wall biosynthesis